MKDFSFKALIVFIIVLVSGLILLPILSPDTDNVGGNGGSYELLVDNELMDFFDFYSIQFDNFDYQIILVSIYFSELNAFIVQNMILNGQSLIDIEAVALYDNNGIIISTDYVGDLKITVWGVSKWQFSMIYFYL